ncbi:MAG: primosomal protein N' [Alphaproteobacteria bacterium]
MVDSGASSDPAAESADNGRVRVMLPLALAGPLDYRAYGALPAPGTFVRVPLGPRERTGVVWDAGDDGDPKIAPKKLKTIIGVLDTPPMPTVTRRFVDWVARYTVSAPGAVLRMAMSVPAALEPETPIMAYALESGWHAPEGFRMTARRAQVLEFLAAGPPRTAADIRAETGVGAPVVAGLRDAGALRAVALAPPSRFAPPDLGHPRLPLSPDQERAAARLSEQVARDEYSATVLDGVTGSGKTEVYFEAIAGALARDRQVLVLLPEIALSAQWLDRFESRFGVAPALWHSELGPAVRRQTWRAIADGGARVVVGARSALFLPFSDLGLIVVDEEHDGSYKQEDGVFYNARDMAVLRAHLGGIPVLLVSATPSLETVVNVERGRYARVHLPDRVGGALLPEVTLIDLRQSPTERGRWLAPPLDAAVRDTLAAGEQVLLFLNRRGYAPLTLCRACGHRLQCPNCSAWLVEHRATGRLDCHHCGFALRLPPACPNCAAEGTWAACGPGVERVAEEVARYFPEARLRIMASDTMGGPAAVRELVAAVAEHRIDVLIGTQVIAKGHHFPLLTLVGVIDADLGLTGGDLRAAERTHQLLTQVSGRAGRGHRPGRVLLQTFMPEHPVMTALARGTRDEFLETEKRERERAHMPPYGRLASVIVSGPQQSEVDATARALGRARPGGDGLEVLGPAPAAMSLLRGRHRRRFLVKAERGFDVQGSIRGWLALVRPGKGVRVQVDIDPMSFL